MDTDEERRGAAPTPVGLDTTANTVKLDPANSTVRLAGTPIPVTQTSTVTVDGVVALKAGQTIEVAKLPAITGTVEVSKMPALPAPVVNVAAPVVNIDPPLFPSTMSVTASKALPVTMGPVELAGPLTIEGLFSERPGTLRYAITEKGGRSGFGSTTGGVLLDDMPTAPPGMAQNRDNPIPVVVAMFVNPANSGVDANLERISLGSSGAGEWTRLGWPERIEIVGPPQNVINRGQGLAVAKCQLYNGKNGRGYKGRRAKTTFQREWSTTDDDIHGTMILRPGMTICWVFELSYGSGQRAAVEIVWWETPAATDPIVKAGA